MAKDPRAQAEHIFHQMLDLLEELSAVCVQAASRDDEEDGELDMSETIESLVEEGAERGLDERAVEQVFKALNAFAERSAEA